MTELYLKKLDEYICQWIRGLDDIIPRLVEKMETSTKTFDDVEQFAGKSGALSASRDEDSQLDQTLSEIRSGRRLEKLVASIQGFLNGQVARLDKALDECQAAVDNDRIMRTVLASFETEQKQWQEKCEAESKRLKAEGQKLAEGWKELEDERRRLLDERSGS